MFFFLWLCLGDREEMERVKEGRKEGGRKEVKKKENYLTISIKIHSPAMFFKEKLASVL